MFKLRFGSYSLKLIKNTYRQPEKESTDVQITQNKGKESENSCQNWRDHGG